MKKYIAVISLMLLLSGCYQSVNSTDIRDAAKICGGLENVVKIDAEMSGAESVTCNDRITRYINSDNLKGK